MNKAYYFIPLCLLLFPLLFAGASKTAKIFSVEPAGETVPVYDDPDDPAIWVNRSNPGKSLILGTDKGYGLLVFDLKGRIVQEFKDGRLNNVDLRQGFSLGGKTVTLAAASDRDDDTIALYIIDEQGTVSRPKTKSMPGKVGETAVSAYIYGLCMYHSQKTGDFYIIVNFTDGHVYQWRVLGNDNGEIEYEHTRTLKVASQPEGCVADDELALLYLGEEDYGIWKYGAEPDDTTEPRLIARVGSQEIPEDDVEGITLYKTDEKTGYIIASSQGDSTYAVYTREGDNSYVGSFAINSGKKGDRVSETDGLDVVPDRLGMAFPKGMLVVQDDKNENFTKNFKIVSFDRILKNLSK